MEKTENNKIIYPRGWSFRIIGMNREAMLKDIANIMDERKYELKDANKKGKYISLNLKLTVHTEGDRNSLFAALKSADSVTMVI